MGSCISKCRSKKKLKEDFSHAQDKLVISQHPPISSLPTKMTEIPSQKPLSPAPSSSLSSFSRSAMTSSTSSSSCSSSAMSVKDRSFSSGFLWSCVKDNPHAVGLTEQSIENTLTCGDRKPPHSTPLSSPNMALTSKKLCNEKAGTPKKRARASSPTLVRQKSFRREHNRGLRSPSPSRRFNGEIDNRSFSTNGISSNRWPVVSKGNNAVSSATSGVRREGFRAPIASPNRDLVVNPDYLVRKKDVFCQHISTKIDAQVGGIKSVQDLDVVMEDINNPLIALDCFIFL